MNNPSQFQPNAGTSKPSFLDSANVPMTPKTEPDPVQSEWVPEDSLSGVVGDVERFARGWIGRIRQLIHRASQLVERESLLVGAIAKLDQQKSDWTKRIEEKESGIREQSKLLSEAWLEVEAERRRTIQGSRAASPSTQVAVAQTPPAQVASAQAAATQVASVQVPAAQGAALNAGVSQPLVGASAANATVNVPAASAAAEHPRVNQPTGNGSAEMAQESSPTSPQMPVPITDGSVRAAGAPIVHSKEGSLFAIPASVGEGQSDEGRQNKIEEFKRMQRSIRNR